jgi:hypothetical protein
MKMILFESTGMVGQGVLRECQQDPSIDKILTVVRKSLGKPLPNSLNSLPKAAQIVSL